MAAETVKVIVRCRPLNQREKDLKSAIVVDMDPTLGHCSISNPADKSTPPKQFTFDGAYHMESTTEQIYNEIVFPIVESVTEGYNGTVFAYGQTGCGKSFTMQGISSPPTQKGIIPRSFEHIFEAISISESGKFLVHATYLEIYNEEIRDLLGSDCRKRLELKENLDTGVYVAGLSMHPVHNVKQCEKIMDEGWKNRSIGSTLMNADSSRSHSIFTVHVERMETGGDTVNGVSIRKGKLNLVDLAGSERQSKTGATGDRLKEATKINLSLSALGNVISALVDGKSKHIPYRDSKLTRLLQDSLGGNTKTLMIACLSPADNNYDETLSTLRYANRAKNIQNAPKINEDPKDALLRQYQEEIMRLKNMLSTPKDQTKESTDDGELIDRLKQEYDEKMRNLIEKHRQEQEMNNQLKSDMNRLRETYEQKRPCTDAEAETQEQVKALERIQVIQGQIVGGEKVNDTELKEKRIKRQKLAEKRHRTLVEALSQVNDDDALLIKAYGDISEELRARTILLKRAKRQITSLEREVTDLSSEFENERHDYLETIRRQDQQIKLLNQILDKVQPCIRRDCNYVNIDRIKGDATWDEDGQKWRLPELVIIPMRLPPPMINQNLRASVGSRLATRSMSPNVVGGPRGGDIGGEISAGLSDDETVSKAYQTLSDDRLRRKLELTANENIAANYFGPSRKDELLNIFSKVTSGQQGIRKFKERLAARRNLKKLTGLHQVDENEKIRQEMIDSRSKLMLNDDSKLEENNNNLIKTDLLQVNNADTNSTRVKSVPIDELKRKTINVFLGKGGFLTS